MPVTFQSYDSFGSDVRWAQGPGSARPDRAISGLVWVDTDGVLPTAIYDAALDAWWPLVGSAGVPATVVAGTTHAAIVAAVLEASTTTHRLYFPAGVYNPTAQIDLTGIWSIRGDGPGLSVIRPSSSLTVGSAWIFRRFAAATLAGFRIEGVTIDANNLGTNSALRMSWVDDFVMRDCEILNVAGGWGVMIGVDDSSIEVAARNHRVSFERCRFDGLGATSTFEQLLVFNTDALSVKECTFGGVVNSLGNSLGLWQGVTNASVLDCSFGLGGRNAYVGLSCNDVTFERNLFEGAQAAIRVGGLPDNGDWGHHVVRGLKVRGNTFRQAAGIAAPDRDRCLYLGGCEDFTVSDNTFEGSYGPATWLGINGAVIVGDQRYSSQGRIADNHYRNCIQGAASHDLNPPIRVDTPSGAFAVNLLVTGNTFTDDQVTKTQYRNLIVAGAGAVTDLTVIGNDWDTTIVGTAPVAKVTGTVTLGDRVRIDSGSTDAQAVVTLSNRTASGVLTAAQTAVDRAGIIKFTTNAGLDFTLPNPSILVPLRVTVVNTGANSCTMYGLTIAAGAIAELLFDGADWRSYSQIAVVDYVVTDGSTAGASGKVPLPAAADFGKALTADASWARVQRLGDLAVADQAGAGVLITADQARTYRQITWTQTTVTLAFTLPTLAAADAGAELSVVAPAGFTATGVTLQGVSVIGSRAYRFHFNGTTWAQITQFTATNGTLVGQAGVVPAPVSGDYGKVLTADSTWSSAQRVGPSSPGNLSSGGALNTANTLRAFPYATWTQTTNSIAATLPNMLAGDAGFVFTLVAAGGFTATGCTIAGRAFGAGMTARFVWSGTAWTEINHREAYGTIANQTAGGALLTAAQIRATSNWVWSQTTLSQSLTTQTFFTLASLNATDAGQVIHLTIPKTGTSGAFVENYPVLPGVTTSFVWDGAAWCAPSNPIKIWLGSTGSMAVSPGTSDTVDNLPIGVERDPLGIRVSASAITFPIAGNYLVTRVVDKPSTTSTAVDWKIARTTSANAIIDLFSVARSDAAAAGGTTGAAILVSVAAGNRMTLYSLAQLSGAFTLNFEQVVVEWLGV